MTEKHQLKLNAMKSVLLSDEVKWCGRILDGEGVRHDPDHLSALVALPLPRTAADLQRFFCACNWIRDSVVDYARVTEVLQDKLNGALANCSRTKRSAAAVQLQWLDEERAAFNATLHSIASSAKQ
ncbi:FOG: Transposon-encoded proteins with TYA, reverse transcriptase, integrase domains in various combinations [Plasmopara halstedii]|uniref:FOG: Transposon-encoded proteins with TYA, reverse transcriptase, integrase domains in various combinations n=1 Tax=Plasmopara halstedii TaxID=4781 RepID=A0A0P1B137_PLAHL|nr:FOG: Transposon-encoded proteins with TYA, reverse transcriptase, integrase domains in various combinations [Plasmopara halstedii]CEG47414.1 FOG: Transposon-encoded proteins with TYA, reverse transcriptase, integrase domains in various combinations [Plasmopara halstedii]|eukprot:XP_024583783.1 FOG: Transposon-encoded proteins with TYA, reverse transcriptase, integrase domains in various combinations [Plasmopara halstedii]